VPFVPDPKSAIDIEPYECVADFENHQISEASVNKAIELVKYFKKTARKVVARTDSPINSLPIQMQQWYKSLTQKKQE